MISILSFSHFLVLIWAALALGHGMVREIWANGHRYNGWDPNGNLSAYPSDTPGWYTTNQGGGPLHPSDANQLQIICAKGGSNANISATVAAGGEVRLRWWQAGQAWPEGHHGPIVDYLASCNGPCSTTDMASLKFVKIDERGWVNSSIYTEGYWASDELIANNGSWTTRIPPNLAPGEYVLRHEIIALHVAFTSTGPYSLDGGEFYPQCVSLKVMSSGNVTITGGVDARTFYKGNEPGLTLNIHNSPNHADYVIPGPAVWTAAN